MDSLSDHVLMLKVKSGDLDRMGLLYTRYHKQLFGFFFKMCNTKDLSEDMVQNVFFRMLKYRHTYKDSGHFRTWLYHLARNVFADNYRKNKRYNWQENMEAQELNVDAEKPQEEVMIENQNIQLLKKAMGNLTDEKRELLVLSKYQGLKYSEIADIMDCNVGTLKVRIHRIVKELQESFNQLEKEGNYDVK